MLPLKWNNVYHCGCWWLNNQQIVYRINMTKCQLPIGSWGTKFSEMLNLEDSIKIYRCHHFLTTVVSRHCHTSCKQVIYHSSLQWCHNEHDGVSNHQPHDCLLKRVLGRRSKKTSKLRVTGLCVGNSPVTGEFPAQMASYAENVSIWWRHHDDNLTQEASVRLMSYTITVTS